MKRHMMKFKEIVNAALASLAAVLLATMAILVVYQVFTRYILSDPSDWTQEVIRYLLIWTGFIGAAYAFGTRQHMSFVYFRDKLDDKKAKVLIILSDIVILLFALFVMVIGGLQLSLSVLGVESALLGVPRGLVYIMAPISGIFIVLIQLVHLWEDFNEPLNVKEINDQAEEGGL